MAYLPLLGETAYSALLRDATPEWIGLRVAEGHRVLVAEDDGAITGLSVDGPNTLDAPADRELRNVYVEPGITSRGVGGALVRAALEAMHADGVRAVSLGVFPSNVRAIAFYERLGFLRHKRTEWTNHGVAFEDQIMIRPL